jgi:hypothetical protein
MGISLRLDHRASISCNRRRVSRSLREMLVPLIAKAELSALAAGQTALRGIANGWGYEITSVDVLDAYAAMMTACARRALRRRKSTRSCGR